MTSPNPDPPLAGDVVVDLSSGIAGAYCTKLLADGGAEVVKVEPPEGDPLRRWSASGAAIAPGDDGALFGYLACSKQSVVADPDDPADVARVTDLLASANAVVWSRGTRLAELPEFAPVTVQQARPHLAVASITPFGLEGPWSDRAATEFTLQAWSGGIVGLGRGGPDRAPIHVGGQVGEWVAGTFAAIGLLASRARRLRTGAGDVVDVSMLEALVLSLTYHPVTFFDALRRPWRTTRSINTPGVAAARDGLVGLGVGTGQQWFDFCTMVGHQEWVEDPALLADRASLAPVIDAWVGERTLDEVCELATAFRIPNAPIGSGASVPDADHFRVRHSLTTNPRDGFTQPAHPYRLHPARLRAPERAPRLGEHSVRVPSPRARSDALAAGAGASAEAGGLPFAGLRVLDMTAFWAGPLCTQLLAMLGAEVIHLESTTRMDGARMVGGVPMTEDRWWERSPIFAGLNTNKKSLTLDFTTDRGREVLGALVATCDVVVENYTPRVLEQVGLDFAALQTLRPDIVMVRMPGFGLDGPWRDNAAFAFVIEDAAGFTWMTGYPDRLPVSPYAIGDPNAGLHALTGLLLALEHRRRTGEGVLVEAAMVDAALNVNAEQIVEHSAYGALLGRAGNRGPVAAPQNLYLSDDVDELGQRDAWVAIAVATDDQWAGLRAALGDPDWAADPSLAHAARRRAHHDVIDGHLAAWCGARAGDEIVDRLWAHDVPVAKVVQPHRQPDLAQLQARGFFEQLDHPVFGSARYSSLPMRFSNGPARVQVQPAPLLGAHNRELLMGLGLTETEIAALEAAGVVGTTPRLGDPSVG